MMIDKLHIKLCATTMQQICLPLQTLAVDLPAVQSDQVTTISSAFMSGSLQYMGKSVDLCLVASIDAPDALLISERMDHR